MGKSKKTVGTGCRKLKELRDQVDGLGDEVHKIERELPPIDALRITKIFVTRGGRVKETEERIPR